MASSSNTYSTEKIKKNTTPPHTSQGPSTMTSYYADHNASALLCPEVKEFLVARLDQGLYANPNASHKLGRLINNEIEKSRALCAQGLGTQNRNIIFNSGSSEGISQVFYSLLDPAPQEQRDLIIISSIEHAAIECSARYFEERGYRLQKIPATQSGLIDMQYLQNIIDKEKERIALVSIIAANNETGVIQPYREIANLCAPYAIPFFSDTTQIIGKAPFSFDESQMDFAVCSGHKIGAPTGIGLIMAKDPKKIRPYIFGGGQEKGLRGGTQNYLGIECLGKAMEVLQKKKNLFSKNENLRNTFENNLKKSFPQIIIFGDQAPRVTNTSFISYPGIDGGDLQYELEKDQIYVTTSSACSDQSESYSKILKAMSIPANDAMGAVRISVGLGDMQELYSYVEKSLSNAFKKLTRKSA